MAWYSVEVVFLKSHERLILGVLALCTVLYLGNAWLNHSVLVANAKVAAAEKVEAARSKANEDLQVSMLQQTASYQALVSELEGQNKALAAAISSRQQVVVQQQTADRALTPTELSGRWTGLSQLSPTDVQFDGQRFSVTDQGAHATVSQLEEVGPLKASLADSQKIVADKSQQLASLKTLQDSDGLLISGLQLQIGEEKRVCSAEVADEKAKGRRGWFRGLKWGLVTGFVSGVVVARMVP